MNLNDLLKEHNLKLQPPSKNEIDQHFKIVARDLKDAKFPGLSPDRKFATAYNAALQLATIVLRANGYRTNPSKAGHHRICIQVLPLIMGEKYTSFSDYLDTCRLKRHACEYTSVDQINERDATQLIEKTESFLKEVT
ncbi:MAG TPA: SAV_6107 family HEPN domain-containing protein, partial [Chlamydiales bacterium]|nr:SAV_6107 family HEPN domain-containing protein [Chlamydiales bacterium]